VKNICRRNKFFHVLVNWDQYLSPLVPKLLHVAPHTFMLAVGVVEIIAGLIERRFPGQEKSRREVTISTDLVYDVLRKHQPDHLLLRAARGDAATGLLDIRRLGEMLSRIRGRIIHKALDHVSPLAVPVMLEIGREQVYGEAGDAILAEAEAELVKEAMQ